MFKSEEKRWVAEPQQTPNVGIVELEPTRNFRGIGIIPRAKLAHPCLGLY